LSFYQKKTSNFRKAIFLFSKNQITLWIKADRPKTKDIEEIKRIIGLKNESKEVNLGDYYSVIKGLGKNDPFPKIIIIILEQGGDYLLQ